MGETPELDGKAILKEMVEGLKNLSRGEWECDITDAENDSGSYTSYMLMDGDGYTIADAINASSTDTVFECDGDGQGNGCFVDALAYANFHHFERCKPSNIRAIAAHVKHQEELLMIALKRVRELEALEAEKAELIAVLKDVERRSRPVPDGNPKWIHDHVLAALAKAEAGS